MIDGVRSGGSASRGRQQDERAKQDIKRKQQIRSDIERRREFAKIMEALMNQATHQSQDGKLYRCQVSDGKEWWSVWRHDVMDWQPISGKPSFKVVEL